MLPAPAVWPGGRRSDSPNPARGGGPALCRKGLPVASGSGSLARRATGGSPNPTRATAPAGGSPNPVGNGPGGRRVTGGPTRAAARPCVGGASHCFRLRQSAPVDEGRQSQPRGRWPGGRQAAVPTPWATAPAGGGATVPAPHGAAARPCVGEASRRFRLRQSGPAGDVRQSQPRGRWPRRAAGDAPTLHGRRPDLAWVRLPAASGSGRRVRQVEDGGPTPVGGGPAGGSPAAQKRGVPPPHVRAQGEM